MWPLGSFESDGIWIPEGANPPSWEGIVAYSAGVVCILVLLLVRGPKHPGESIPRRFKALIPLAIPALLGLFTFLSYGRLTGLTWYVPVGLGYVIYMIVLTVKLCRRPRPPRAVLRVLSVFVIGVVFVLSLACYQMSYPYYLPASYPEPTRSQLRMLRRLIQVERGDDEGKAKMIPLSEARLTYEGKELIPDSVRENGRFGAYQYSIHFDTPREGLFTIDAVPVESKTNLYSFHVFPTNPESLDNEYKYIVYCITMARRNGEPATADDPHFHKRGMIKILCERLRSGRIDRESNETEEP